MRATSPNPSSSSATTATAMIANDNTAALPIEMPLVVLLSDGVGGFGFGQDRAGGSPCGGDRSDPSGTPPMHWRVPTVDIPRASLRGELPFGSKSFDRFARVHILFGARELFCTWWVWRRFHTHQQEPWVLERRQFCRVG